MTAPEMKLMRRSTLAFLALAFGIAYTQNPLYTANQNTYFLHGLKAAGLGFLTNDWMANTVDPFPVFSWMVHWTAVILSPFAFHLYQAAMLGIYILGVVAIACKSFDIEWTSSRGLLCFLILTGLHSAALADFSTGLFGKNLVLLVDVGLAQQSLIAHELIPASFGVMFIASVYAFLIGRPFLAVFLSALAIAFHSIDLISGMTLILIYVVLIFREERNKRKAVIAFFLGFLLLLPTLIFVLSEFRPTSALTFTQAENILAHFRIPQHAEPGRWFNKQALGVFAIMVIGLYVARKTRVFPILLIAFVVGLFLTLDQIATSSNTLALLFPWRVSTWLLPISWGVIVAWFIRTVFAKGPWLAGLLKQKAFNLAVLTAIVILALYGGWRMLYGRLDGHSRRNGESMMQFVSRAAAPNQLYLIPIDMEVFRLRTGVPILVDWKTHPYRDTEVIEWYQRLRIADRFYRSGRDSALQILSEIYDEYGVTHVVLRTDSDKMTGILRRPIYGDDKYVVYDVRDLGFRNPLEHASSPMAVTSSQVPPAGSLPDLPPFCYLQPVSPDRNRLRTGVCGQFPPARSHP
jgi:hypothetical protein